MADILWRLRADISGRLINGRQFLTAFK